MRVAETHDETDIDIRMMGSAGIPAMLEIQAVCYTEVTSESNESLHAKLCAHSGIASSLNAASFITMLLAQDAVAAT